MKIKNIAMLIVWVVVAELAGGIGSIFTAPNIASWYTELVKPSFNPPSWVFGPVWTTLFLFMGIAAFLVWQKGWDRKQVKIALAVFMAQLVLNVAWSAIFFGQRNLGGAFAEIIILWLAILANIILFVKISKKAAWLLVPYILWVSFAGFLNFTIWQINSHPPINKTLPIGYSLDSYKVEKVLDIACKVDNDCQTPPEYLMRSNCPYTSVCSQNKCNVVCPNYKR
ncbi:MAG: tryptophan-rich sensory protein [Candidatus Doudnabacteria bacterium]|nr:tryptophan-rich sensory protein [Candidatus Doudnabacteria bacterium]